MSTRMNRHLEPARPPARPRPLEPAEGIILAIAISIVAWAFILVTIAYAWEHLS